MRIDQAKPLYTVDEAAQIMRVGKTKFYALLKTGKISALKNGKATLVTAEAISQWIEALPSIETKGGANV